MSSLYQIDEAILRCLDMETGEVIDEEMLDALSMERDEKIQGICLWIKNLKAEKEALKAEKDAFAQRQKTVENKIESLTKYITGYLDGAPFKTTKVAVSFRKSESVEIAEGAVVPEEYLRIKTEADKTALKQALKAGKQFEGIAIVEKNNIQIK